MKYLITGCAGFIGFHLTLRLLKEQKIELIGLDNLNNYYDVNLKRNRLNILKKNKNFRFFKIALEDKKAVLDLITREKFTKIIHLGAQAGVRHSLSNPYAYTRSNIEGFLTILEAVKKKPIEHLIYASSSSVYGLNSKMPFSAKADVSHPTSIYAATKKANELMAHSYSHIYNIPTTGLRFFTAYGPYGRPDMSLFIFTKSILNNKAIDVFAKEKMQRDFTYIDDLIDAILAIKDKIPKGAKKQTLAADESSAPYKIYNIGSNNPIKITQYISLIEKELGKTAKKNYLPIQPGDIYKTYADMSEFKKDFKFIPKTPMQIGVKNFVTWFKDYYKIA